MRLAGVVLAPLALLAYISAASALAPLVCKTQDGTPLVLAGVVLLAAALAGAAMAWRVWRGDGRRLPGDSGDAEAGTAFLGLVGLVLSAYFALGIAVMIFAPLVVPPCAP